MVNLLVTIDYDSDIVKEGAARMGVEGFEELLGKVDFKGKPAFLKVNPELREWKVETMCLERLASFENVPTIIESFEHDGYGFLLMEYMEGNPIIKTRLSEETFEMIDQVISFIDAFYTEQRVSYDDCSLNDILEGSPPKMIDFDMASLDQDNRYFGLHVLRRSFARMVSFNYEIRTPSPEAQHYKYMHSEFSRELFRRNMGISKDFDSQQTRNFFAEIKHNALQMADWYEELRVN